MRLFDELSLKDIRSTTTFRLATMLGILFTLGVVALGALIYGLTTRELTARSDQILHHEAARLLRVPANQLAIEIPKEVERNTRGLDRFSLLSPEGRLLTGSIPPPPNLTVDVPVDVEARAGLGPMRVLAVRAANRQIILLARDISEIRYLERHILIVIVVSCLAIVPGVLLIGTVLSFQPLRRVQELQTIAGRVAAGEFALRMPGTGRGDELDRIALTVNMMIEDIGRIVDQVKNVTDAVAHDLRTPLTRVRSRLEGLRAVADETHGAVVDALIDDLDVVLERFAALLRISEIEAREQRSGFTSVPLAALVRDVVDLYQPLAEEAGISIRGSEGGEISVHADRSLLFEALNNLVDNAVKYARREVFVAIFREGAVAMITVRDDGRGIPANERDAVLRRFYRSDTPGIQGKGLGLSVVAAILHLHRFKLELADARPGLLAKIAIPLDQ